MTCTLKTGFGLIGEKFNHNCVGTLNVYEHVGLHCVGQLAICFE